MPHKTAILGREINIFATIVDLMATMINEKILNSETHHTSFQMRRHRTRQMILRVSICCEMCTHYIVFHV